MILSENDVQTRLKSWMGAKIGAAKDRVLYGFGSKSAEGRLNIRAVTQNLINDWRRYAAEERQGGNTDIDPENPTSENLTAFLRAKYNLVINVDQVENIADAPVKDIADGDVGLGGNKNQPNADPKHPTDDMKATSKKEYDNLQKMFRDEKVSANPNTKSSSKARSGDPLKDKLRADMEKSAKEDQYESVQINEDGVPIRQVFGKLALAMWRAGLVTIDRNGKTQGSMSSHATSSSPSSKEGGGRTEKSSNKKVDFSTAIDDDGNYLDARILRQMLMSFGIDGRKIAVLQSLLSSHSAEEVFEVANDEQRAEMIAVATSAMESIRRTKSTMRAGDNVTSSGNTLNFKKFKKILQDEGVTAAAFNEARAKLMAHARDGVISTEEVTEILADIDLPLGAAVMGVLMATVNSIVTVAGTEDEEEDTEAEK